MTTTDKIEINEINLRNATTIIEWLTGSPGAIRPSDPCIMFEPSMPHLGTLRLRSKLTGRNAGDIILVDDLQADSLGDGWQPGDERLLIEWLNENCDFSAQ